MTLGAFRHLVTIRAPATGRDEIGQPVTGWTDFAQDYADIRYLRGLEAIRAGAQAATSNVSIRLRTFRLDLTTAMEVDCEGVTYAVLAVLPDMQRRRYVDLQCTASS